MVDVTPTIIDEAMARDLLPNRDAAAHKWDVGGVIVVAGSPSYPGAALLASRAAGRAGAGIVYLATGRGIISTIASAIPEVAYIPLPETESSSGARRAAELIAEHLPRAHSLVIGPGLGGDDASDSLLSAIFGFGGRSESVRGLMGFGRDAGSVAQVSHSPASVFHHDLPIIVDADGLNWLARQGEWWTQVPQNRLLLTPHPGEMARLLDIPVDDIVADPVTIARDAARKWGQTVLLKGGHAVVSDGDSVIVADHAAGSLATAGSGDVLAGIIGGLAAQTRSLLNSAALAIYVGPRAARRVEDRFGVLGVVGTDLPDAIATEISLVAS
jgi:NAD(P)H-hydrate epimerase